MAAPPSARWWQIRRATNRKPVTYRCPLCGRQLPALSEHMLIVPEGDSRGRRHAHSACVMAARAAGRLPTHDEWRRAQRPPVARGENRGAGDRDDGSQPRWLRPWRWWRSLTRRTR